MAKGKLTLVEASAPDEEAPARPGYVLLRSFGYLDGRRHVHLPAGTILDAEHDRALIARLFKSGAAIAPR